MRDHEDTMFDNTNVPPPIRPSGVPNQSVTKPITLNAETAEVIVKTSSGKPRIRKGQTEEQFQEQLDHFLNVEGGPVRTPMGWMSTNKFNELLDDETFDLEVKHNRLVLMGFIHRFYYNREYQSCLQCCEKVAERYTTLACRKKMTKELEELDYIVENCKRRR